MSAPYHTLDAFAQGYVEAMLKCCNEDQLWPYEPLTIADLAPETIERIVADCAARGRHHPSEIDQHKGLPVRTSHDVLTNNGWRFWARRQRGLCKNFPPLTVALNDSGQVVFQSCLSG